MSKAKTFGIKKAVGTSIGAAGASLGYDPFTHSLPMKRAPNSSKQPKVRKSTYAGK